MGIFIEQFYSKVYLKTIEAWKMLLLHFALLHLRIYFALLSALNSNKL